MRIATLALLLVALAGVAVPANADACRSEDRETLRGDKYQVEVCEGAGSSTTPATKTTTKTATNSRRYQPNELVRVVSSVDGVQCSMWATRTSVQGRQAIAARADFEVVGDVFDTSVWDVWQGMVAAMGACGARGAGDPAEQSVFAFLYEYRTPDPDPWIAPGFAITGKRAFLETRGPTSHQPTPVETPLGRLEVTFEATAFIVDWGDGSGPQQHASPGRPWPEGEASHVYTHMGTYDVVVAQRWRASWRLGDRSGEVVLTGAPSVIEAFEVGQLQAVRDR